MEQSKDVFGIYKSRESTENAVSILKENGFRLSDISVLLPQQNGMSEFFGTRSTKSQEDAAAGGGTGAIIGGALGLLAGAGVLAVPGIGPFIVAGPIVSVLARVGVLSGAFVGFGIPEYMAKRYQSYVEDGGILMSVHADDNEWADQAHQLFVATGAQNISVFDEVEGDSNSDFRAPLSALIETAKAKTIF